MQSHLGLSLELGEGGKASLGRAAVQRGQPEGAAGGGVGLRTGRGAVVLGVGGGGHAPRGTVGAAVGSASVEAVAAVQGRRGGGAGGVEGA